MAQDFLTSTRRELWRHPIYFGFLPTITAERFLRDKEWNQWLLSNKFKEAFGEPDFDFYVAIKTRDSSSHSGFVIRHVKIECDLSGGFFTFDTSRRAGHVNENNPNDLLRWHHSVNFEKNK